MDRHGPPTRGQIEGDGAADALPGAGDQDPVSRAIRHRRENGRTHHRIQAPLAERRHHLGDNGRLDPNVAAVENKERCRWAHQPPTQDECQTPE